MKIGTIKADTPKVQPHDILESEKTPKSGIRLKNLQHTIITPDQAQIESTMWPLSKMHPGVFHWKRQKKIDYP